MLGLGCCAGFSLVAVRGFLIAVTPLIVEHRLSNCGAQGYLPRGMWDLPGSGIEPMSPALQGRFLTTRPPVKPLFFLVIGERLPTPVFWPSEFHGLYNPWGHKELDMTE